MTQLYITTTTTTTTKGGKISINLLSCHLTSYVSSPPSRHLCAGGQTHISLSPSQPAALIPSLSDHPSNPLSPIQVSQASSSLVNPLYCYSCLSHTIMISLAIAHISFIAPSPRIDISVVYCPQCRQIHSWRMFSMPSRSV